MNLWILILTAVKHIGVELFCIDIEYHGACQKWWHSTFIDHEKGWIRQGGARAIIG